MNIPELVSIVGFAPNEQAARRTAEEIRRIGRVPEVFLNIASAWDEVCIESLKDGRISGYMSKPSSFSCLRGHYHVLKAAYDRGFDSVWIVEDDARFLKDTTLLEETLFKAPSDADILMLESYPSGDYNGDVPMQNLYDCRARAAAAVGGWWRVENEDLRGAASYIVSRRAMERMLALYSHEDKNSVLLSTDQTRMAKYYPSMNIYAAYPLLAIQQEDDYAEHMTSSHRYYYARFDVNTDNYQEW